MFVLFILCIILTVSVDASQLQLRVVEIDSMVEISSGTSTEICTINEVDGCSFDVSKESSVFIRVVGPNGDQFETSVSALRGSNAVLFVHLSNSRHYFTMDKSPKVGDLLNNRLLSGLVIPQTSGRRRKRVSFRY